MLFRSESSRPPGVTRRSGPGPKLAGKLMSGADLLKAHQAANRPLTPNPSPPSTGARGAKSVVDSSLSDQTGAATSSLAPRPLPLAPRFKTLWNDPSTVEVTGENARYGWFMHALTRDEWLLKLKFRVEKNRFDEADLQARFALTSVDDLNEIPVYGRGDRVNAKNQRGAFQEVTVTVHSLKDIDTPEFWEFLQDAR